jgi:mannose-1-phosphate guanylyltransferase/mannose-6-phosphate isomerase
MPAQIIPIVMCGGAGTRLWPVSRESMPKQFVSLIGEGSTFQQVIGRVSYPELFASPIVITNAKFRFVVAEQLRDRGTAADIVLEPLGATPALRLPSQPCSPWNAIRKLSC